MSSLSFSPAARVGGERDNFVLGSNILVREQILGYDLQKCPFYGIGGATNRRRLSVPAAKIRKGKKHDYPWPKVIDANMESGHLSYLSQFKPLTEKPKPVTLAFEKPLVDLEKKIIDVRKMAAETGLDFSDQINLLESKYQQAVKDLYSKLTPFQRLHMARHPNRPTFLDHILNITDKWVELHGDRAGYDDPAIVTGLGSIDGKTYMFIGHQKGRNTKENIKRNFGMPTPHGYRKALRMMRYADHHGFPIITFVDTPGAFADLKSEELGQGEAIAFNLREMFGLKVPMVSVVIGEGGSGGALAICCANKLLMLENSVFYVASPEACAAILWKDSQASPKAAERLRITPKALRRLKIADGIIPEPLGGAHLNPTWASQQIKIAVMNAMEELSELDNDSLLHQRYMKYRILGGFDESKLVDPVKKSRMKKKDVKMIPVEKSSAEDVNTLGTDGGHIKIENLKKSARQGKVLPVSAETITKVRQEVDKELTNAFISMGLREELESLKTELSRSPETIDPALKERANRLVQEFKQKFDCPESFLQLKEKLKVLSWVNMLQKQILEKKRSRKENEKAEKLKGEINEKLLDKMKAKMEVLRTTRMLVASGKLLDADQIEAVEAARDELIELLKSVNLELVGLGTTKLSTTPPGLEAELTKVDDVVMKEIDKAVEKAGLRCKIEELKSEIANGSNEEKIEQLVSEIREEIAAAIDLTELRKRVEASVGSFIQEPAYAGCV